MAHKISDLAVKTGEYVDQQGQTKGRYENVGSLMQGDNGMFLILKRTFNPAGVPNPESKDSVIVSCFEKQEQGQQQGTANNQYQGNGQQGGANNQGHGQYQGNNQQGNNYNQGRG